MKNVFYTIACVLIVLFALANQCDKSLMRDAAEKAKQPKEKIHCIVCGEDLTDTYQRICPNGKEYFCMPCYNGTMKGIHDKMRAEGYNTTEYINSPQAYSSSHNHSHNTIVSETSDIEPQANIDENSPDSKKCKVCNGTGIEERHYEGHEDERRTCTQCFGRGYEGY